MKSFSIASSRIWTAATFSVHSQALSAASPRSVIV